MNWIEQKLKRESNLSNGAPEIWQKVRMALEGACITYGHSYSTEGKNQILLESENGKISVQKNLQHVKSVNSWRDDTFSVVVSFDSERPAINVAGGGPVKAGRFVIFSDEDAAYIGRTENSRGSTERRFDVEEVSKKILEPLLSRSAGIMRGRRLCAVPRCRPQPD
jgi:hypothetical protein